MLVCYFHDMSIQSKYDLKYRPNHITHRTNILNTAQSLYSCLVMLRTVPKIVS